MPYITTQDGTTLFYKDIGSGEPIVLIHGWPLNSDMWEYQATFLSLNGYRVIAYDRRGFGKSSQPFTGHDFNTLSDDLAAILHTLDLTRVTLVGFSMGGGEVIRYLSRHGSARIARAALVSAVPPYLLKTSDNPDGVDSSVFDDMKEQILKDRYDFLTQLRPQVLRTLRPPSHRLGVGSQLELRHGDPGLAQGHAGRCHHLLLHGSARGDEVHHHPLSRHPWHRRLHSAREGLRSHLG